MRFDRLTQKSQEAVQTAQQSLRKYGHQELTSAHLLKAFAEQPEGIVSEIVKQLRMEPAKILDSIQKQLMRIPKVHSDSTQLY
ncbi:hypothetical protein KDK77_08545, partial [bacterium]|nr:hypothetical protein [bacterium]